jgi:hypothetical protein
MNRILVLAIVALIVTAHRLPAPIRDEPTPAPKPKATAKPKPQAESEKTHEVKKSASPSQLAGTWTGFINVVGNNGSSSLWDFVITVSSDAKAASTKWKLSIENKWGAAIQSPCQGEGNLIRWSVLVQNGKTAASHSFTLKLHDNRTATFSWHGQIPSDGFTADGTGVMTKQ